jgi:hypothetical protein
MVVGAADRRDCKYEDDRGDQKSDRTENLPHPEL